MHTKTHTHPPTLSHRYRQGYRYTYRHTPQPNPHETNPHPDPHSLKIHTYTHTHALTHTHTDKPSNSLSHTHTPASSQIAQSSRQTCSLVWELQASGIDSTHILWRACLAAARCARARRRGVNALSEQSRINPHVRPAPCTHRDTRAGKPPMLGCVSRCAQLHAPQRPRPGAAAVSSTRFCCAFEFQGRGAPG